MMIQRYLRGTLILGSFLLSGCDRNAGTEVPSIEHAQHPLRDRFALAVAKSHLDVLSLFRDGKHTGGGELADAFDFFRTYTGISVRWGHDGFRAAPSNETDVDLAKIREWLRTDSHRLRWDEEAGLVKLQAEHWKPTDEADQVRLHRLGISFWNRQLEKITRFSREGGNDRGFALAADSLTALTRIPVDWDGTYIGVIPTTETHVNIRQLRKWFNENCSRIYWDEANGELRLGDAKAPNPDPECVDK